MSAAKVIGARLRRLREEPRDEHGRAHRSREKWALMLRSAADPAADGLPGIKSLAKMIAQWERGDHVPGPIYRPLYAKVTGKAEAELFGEAMRSSAPVARHDALPLASAAGAASRRRSAPVAPELADYFAEQLAGHYRADRHLGPFRLIPTAAAQYELLCDLAAGAQAPLRRRLWSLAAGFAAFLGWLYQDGGDLDRSAHWHDLMLERAHRSHDPQLVAFALHNKAMLLADLGDGRGVLDLTGAVLAYSPGLIPKVRVLALQQSAHGVSLAAGDDDTGEAADECARLLDDAAALVERVDDVYPWGGACRTTHYLDVQRATYLTRLGRADEALTIWERIMPALVESGARRDVGVFKARQAQAYASRREPEQAVTVAGEVVAVAEETGSARMRRELRTLGERMRPWASERPGRRLAEMLAGMGGHA
ncbi:Twin-arginine translocation pathway signal [Actinomadura decatromicini]|uniref:Twin-arginine translocation pathway signal n=1 Tax=Actinomadura decatromicini TaxID=2604572 RepID=A0A5D3FSJ6_9ACTN|nr:Twin-arginine translocation pathway signal [Actinomadura decatromicini]TYK50876.1 Twin-arginine translocation pathway signal [Actinomadura decatromicini]